MGQYHSRMEKRNTANSTLSFESLECRRLLDAQFVISEFMADNDGSLQDGYGNSPDWIEIHNTGDQSANLRDWYLTDQADDLLRWKFPAVNLAADDYLIVFASGRTNANTDPAGFLHANFKLRRNGEYLALVQPDGQTIASEFSGGGQDYPRQFENISFGSRRENVETPLTSKNASRFLIPDNASIDNVWADAAFNDEDWAEAPMGIGFTDNNQGTDGIHGIKFWLRADHITGLRSGDVVETWPDSSGRGHTVFQKIDRERPIWHDTGVQPVLRFDGIDDSLDINDLSLGRETTIFLVATNRSPAKQPTDARQLIFSIGDTTDVGGYDFAYGGDDTPGFSVIQTGPNAPTESNLTHRGVARDKTEIFAFRRSSHLAELWRDGKRVVTKPIDEIPLEVATGSLIGGRSNLEERPFQGDLHEILVFPRAISNDEFAAITKYLTNRYRGDTPVSFPELVSYWKFEGRLTDELNNHHGIELENSASFSSNVSVHGGAHSLDLTHDNAYVTLPSTDFGITREYTVSAWVKRNGNGSGRFFAAKRDLTSGGTDRSGIALGLDGDHLYAGVISSDNYDHRNTGDTFHDYKTTQLTVAENTWTHVAVTVGGDYLTLYVNGIAETVYDPGGGAGHSDGRLKVSGRNIDFIDSDGSFSGFGADGNAPAHHSTGGNFTRIFYDGWLDDVAIWNTSLPAEAIVRLAQGESPLSVPIQGITLPDIGAAKMDAARLSAHVTTDVSSNMLGAESSGVNATAYIRIPFHAEESSSFEQMWLKATYDDGFIAYLNGVEIARRNVVGRGRWNSSATDQRPISESAATELIDVSPHQGLLIEGNNLLAIHAMNSHPTDPVFLADFELIGSDVGQSATYYFTAPTPGEANRKGINHAGPMIVEVTHAPSQPTASEPLIVSARVLDHATASVTLTYRVMFGEHRSIVMTDDGSRADKVAGDGVFTATIPAEAYTAGQLVRYFVTTADQFGNRTRKPEFPLPKRSARYLGTVVMDPTIPATQLPVVEWFVEVPHWYRDGNTNNREEISTTIFYNDRLYDNVRVRVRGGVTFSQPKPNFKFDFYSGGRFQYDDNQPSVEEINLQSLMGELPIRTYMRNPLAYQLFRDTGHAAPESFYIHVRQNGEFYGLAAFEEQIDRTFLEKHGFDPEGALYKARNGAMLQTEPSNVEWGKASRNPEDFSDLVAFTNGLAAANIEERRRFLFDNVNLPQVIHYLAVSLLGPHHDRLTHNYYVFRDTNDTGEWSIFPWDMDRFFPQGDLLTNRTATPIFYGDSDHPRWPGTPVDRYNRLNDAIFDVPETRDMFVTHLASMVDQWLNSAYLENSADELAGLIELDATLDQEKWRLGELNSGVAALKQTIQTRRDQLRLDPHLQRESSVFVDAGSTVSLHVPRSNALSTNWTSGTFIEGTTGDDWIDGKLSVGYASSSLADEIVTDVKIHFPDQQTSLYLRHPFPYDGTKLKDLLLQIRYDDAFVAYLNGTEIARSGNLPPGTPSFDSTAQRSHSSRKTEIFDVSQSLEQLIIGDNLLAIHLINRKPGDRDLFVLPQLLGTHPTDNSTANIRFGAIETTPNSNQQDQEYVELVNHDSRSIDLSGWQITGGIRYEFQPGTVIPAGASLYLSPRVRAFRTRATGPSGGQGLMVQGDYAGNLSSRGETIELRTAIGDLVTSFTTPSVPSAAQSYLRLTELHYHPQTASAEFIELRNISSIETLDLRGIRVSEGPSEPFNFTASQVTSLGPGEFVLLVKDLPTFTETYPNVDSDRIAGEYSGNLSNGGETIKIEDATNGTVLEFRYEDGRDDRETDWPSAADGEGYSLVIVDSQAAPDAWNLGSGWRASSQPGGSPGREDRATLHADINEDGRVNEIDIDLVSSAIRANDNRFDVDGNGVTDLQDRNYLIETVLETSLGDSNLDGRFDLLDLQLVRQAGEYDNRLDGGTGWAHGDWNGDGKFTSEDLVAAFQTGRFQF